MKNTVAHLVVLAGAIAFACGHGAVTHPRPRNAIDSDVAPWVNPVPMPVPFEPWCPFGDVSAVGKNPENLTGANGQACFWFSNGCTIGCESCDGDTRGPIPNAPCPKPDDGKTMCARKMPACKTGALYNATNCDSRTRTVNTDVECGAEKDFYYYSPWRAPGAAPVFDSCGLAGGRTSAQGDGSFGATYTDTPNAKQGDAGSGLAPTASQATWKRGSTVEVAWALQANHGGGYQYRLCPRDQPLTEECFFKIPLRFTGPQAFRWGGEGGERYEFNGTYVTEGTLPAGSMWSMNPIPRNDVTHTGAGFKPRCAESPDCKPTSMASGCRCSGMWGPYNLEIVDQLVVPDSIPAGEYVLGWRWDCEESSQIWQSCSDITIA